MVREMCHSELAQFCTFIMKLLRLGGQYPKRVCFCFIFEYLSSVFKLYKSLNQDLISEKDLMLVHRLVNCLCVILSNVAWRHFAKCFHLSSSDLVGSISQLLMNVA